MKIAYTFLAILCFTITINDCYASQEQSNTDENTMASRIASYFDCVSSCFDCSEWNENESSTIEEVEGCRTECTCCCCGCRNTEITTTVSQRVVHPIDKSVEVVSMVSVSRNINRR